jgi:Reverse transcriptase (RNA-dependent DNA polymerase)
MGPYSVHNTTDRLITVVNDHGQLVTFAIPQVKPYIPGHVQSLLIPLTSHVRRSQQEVANNAGTNQATDDSYTENPEIAPIQDAATLTALFVKDTVEAVKRNTQHVRIHVTGIVDAEDPRATCPKMQRAKLAEMKGLLDKGVFEIVLREDIPAGANTLGGRYVLALKDPRTETERWKARFVVQGHKDVMKRAIVHDTATISQRGARMIFAMAAIFGWKVWTEDVRQAYLQRSGRLSRDVFLTNLNGAEAELRLKPHEALRLLRPLYGLSEAGDLWHSEFSSQYRDKLGMQELKSEPALYAKFKEDVLRGLTGIYVDDTISTGTDEFEH